MRKALLTLSNALLLIWSRLTGLGFWPAGAAAVKSRNVGWFIAL
jgi:hypothetical protein